MGRENAMAKTDTASTTGTEATLAVQKCLATAETQIATGNATLTGAEIKSETSMWSPTKTAPEKWLAAETTLEMQLEMGIVLGIGTGMARTETKSKTATETGRGSRMWLWSAHPRRIGTAIAKRAKTVTVTRRVNAAAANTQFRGTTIDQSLPNVSREARRGWMHVIGVAMCGPRHSRAHLLQSHSHEGLPITGYSSAVCRPLRQGF